MGTSDNSSRFLYAIIKLKHLQTKREIHKTIVCPFTNINIPFKSKRENPI